MAETTPGQRQVTISVPRTSHSMSTYFGKRGPRTSFRTTTSWRDKQVWVRCCGVCNGSYEFDVSTPAEFALAREDESQRRLRVLVGLVVAIPAWSAAIHLGQQWDVASLTGWAALGAKLGLYAVAPLALSAFVATTVATQVPSVPARIAVQLAIGLPSIIAATAVCYAAGFLVGERVEDGTGGVVAGVIGAIGFAFSTALLVSAMREAFNERRQLEQLATNSGQPIPVKPSTPAQSRASAAAGLLFFASLVPARALWIPQPPPADEVFTDAAPVDDAGSRVFPMDGSRLKVHGNCTIKRKPSDGSSTFMRVDAGTELKVINDASAPTGWRQVEAAPGQSGWARQKCFD